MTTSRGNAGESRGSSHPFDGKAPDPIEVVRQEQQASRDALLQGLLWTAAVAAVAAASFGVRDNLYRWATAPFLILTVVLVVAAFGRALSFRARAGLLVVSLYLACVIGLVVGGIAPNAVVGLCAVSGVCAMLLGRRAGVSMLVASTATIILVSVGYITHVIELPPDWIGLFDPTQPKVVARISTIFVAAAGILVFGISHLLGRTETLLQNNTRALKELQQQVEESRRLEESLERQRAAVKRAEEVEVLFRLASYGTHDFNNSLLVIKGAVRALREDLAEGQPVSEDLELLQTAADSASETARQLQALSSGENLESCEIDAGEQTRRLGRMLGFVLPERITSRVDIQVQARIATDVTTFQRTIMNLALNARDAMPEGGELKLVVRLARKEELGWRRESEAQFVCVDVIDSGRGIEEHDLARIFEPYFSTKGSAGTGLGLPSVRDALRAKNGEVVVQSSPNQGTTFSTYWRVVTNAASPTAEPPVAI